MCWQSAVTKHKPVAFVHAITVHIVGQREVQHAAGRAQQSWRALQPQVLPAEPGEQRGALAVEPSEDPSGCMQHKGGS